MEELRDIFITNTYNQNFKKQYSRFLNIIDNYEKKFNKDLFEFNESEIEKLLEEYSFSTIKLAIVFIKKYREFCSELVNAKCYPLNWNDKRLNIDKYLESKPIYIIRNDDLNNIINRLDDSFTGIYFKTIIIAANEGVVTLNNYFIELLSLREKDINGNELNLITNRKVHVSNLLIKLLKSCKGIEEIAPCKRKVVLSRLYKNSILRFPGNNMVTENPSKENIKKTKDTLDKSFKRFMKYNFNVSVSLSDIVKSFLIRNICEIGEKYIDKDIYDITLWDRETHRLCEEFLSKNGYMSGLAAFIRLNTKEINEYKESL